MALILTSIGIIGALFLSMAIHLIDVNAIKFLFTMDGIIDESQTYTLLQYFYWSTYQHISSYLIGILLGFIIQKYDKININSTVQNLLTILFSIGFFCSIHWTRNWMNSLSPETEPSYLESNLFMIWYKLLFLSLPAWIIILGAYQHQGTLNLLFYLLANLELINYKLIDMRSLGSFQICKILHFFKFVKFKLIVSLLTFFLIKSGFY